MSIYGSEQEKLDMELIRKLFPSAEIYNPAEDKEAKEGYKSLGMDYFTRIVERCDLIIFRGLPFGKISAGIYKEICCARIYNIPILELPTIIGRDISIEETKGYLRECGFR
jgi:hypothetical protein